MAISVTAEQALSLAPDPESAKAARSLATPRPWSALGRDDRAIWGACQGSGKEPYRTQIDWLGPAFKCSCPSRKFPCKHGLGLLLLLAGQPGLFKEGAPPAWVGEWLASREEKAESKAKREAAAATPMPDPAASAKRAEQRGARVSQGLEDVALWLRDIVEQGFATLPSRPYSFWDQQAARLVDAQAPGVARLLGEMGTIAAAGEGWQHRLVNAFGRLNLLIQAYRRIDKLPGAVQDDVRAAVGFTVAQESVLAGEAVRDRWFVAAQSVEQEERLRVQRTWLLGNESRRAALILEFAAGPAAVFKSTMIVGSAVDAELCFYPGAAPLRALIKQVHAARPGAGFPHAATVPEAYGAWRDRLAANPWTEDQPAALAEVVPLRDGARWLLCDRAGTVVPLRSDPAANLILAAVSAGHPLAVFGVWDGYSLQPLTAIQDGRVLALRRPVESAA